MIWNWAYLPQCRQEMIGQRQGEVGGGHEQLVLAFVMQGSEHDAPAAAVTRRRVSRARNGRGCFAPSVGVASPPRARRFPARDSRGRFVARPASDAPNWYVFCADHYRVPGEPEVALQADPSSTPPVTTRSKARTWRWRCTRSALESYFLVLLVMVVSIWYRWHLPPPNR
jgi:hypothetical protein